MVEALCFSLIPHAAIWLLNQSASGPSGLAQPPSKRTQETSGHKHGCTAPTTHAPLVYSHSWSWPASWPWLCFNCPSYTTPLFLPRAIGKGPKTFKPRNPKWGKCAPSAAAPSRAGRASEAKPGLSRPQYFSFFISSLPLPHSGGGTATGPSSTPHPLAPVVSWGHGSRPANKHHNRSAWPQSMAAPSGPGAQQEQPHTPHTARTVHARSITRRPAEVRGHHAASPVRTCHGFQSRYTATGVAWSGRHSSASA